MHSVDPSSVSVPNDSSKLPGAPTSERETVDPRASKRARVADARGSKRPTNEQQDEDEHKRPRGSLNYLQHAFQQGNVHKLLKVK